MTHLTGFSGFPARRAECSVAWHHKRGATLSGKPENPAFGGPNRPAGRVAMLARYPASHSASLLPGRADFGPCDGSLSPILGIGSLSGQCDGVTRHTTLHAAGRSWLSTSNLPATLGSRLCSGLHALARLQPLRSPRSSRREALSACTDHCPDVQHSSADTKLTDLGLHEQTVSGGGA